MGRSRILGVACLVVAAVLLAWGLDASNSLGSGYSRIFRGTPTNQTMRLYIGAAIFGVAGLALLGRRARP